MKLTVFDTAGKELRQIDAADEVFGIEPNRAVLHQAYVAQMSNRRAGNAHTKTRGEVEGSTKKIRRQKGLGVSRQGGVRASHHVGGGVAFGPRHHDYIRDLPRTMKRLALRSALSSHAADGDIIVVEGLVPAQPRTKDVQATLKALAVERKALLVSGEYEPNLTRAGSNLDYAKVLPAANLNVVDVLNAHKLVLTEEAVRKIEALWGGLNVKPARGRRVEEAV
ncbi:hypothetical protein AYO38_11920 [bacterium SCGC AG-212-C10]|nr:hypothetical protein AYO38_11920 [bacterium SCGC AG-212-C10]